MKTYTEEQMKLSSKHEPGPWVLGGCSGRMITTPSGYVGDGFIADVDTKANAHLISASPEAIEFIADLLKHIDDINKLLKVDGFMEGYVNRGEEIIKKAYNL